MAHTARAWTEPEKRYSQIEKESNAMLTGIASNKMYLLGKQFEAVWTTNRWFHCTTHRGDLNRCELTGTA